MRVSYRMPHSLALAATVWVLGGTAASVLAVGGPDRRPYNIVCTVGMVTDIVKNVAGDRADVEGIIGEGVDPHLYQSTRRDIGKLLSADVVFYSGLMLEGRMTDALIKVGQTRPVFAVTKLIDESLLLSPPGSGRHHDPHVWMDPVLWKQCAKAAAEALAGFDEANADYYRTNYERYAVELDRLYAYAKGVLASVPERSRVIVTAHDAFNYLARSFEFEVRGVQGISTESEAGIDDVNALVELIVSRDIKAVFVETSVSDKNVRSLIEGAGARGHTVVIGGSLFSDAMGQPGTYEGTYIGMIDHNVTTIARALGGSAPPRGMQGNLSPLN